MRQVRSIVLLLALICFSFSSHALAQWHQMSGPWAGNFQCFAVSPSGTNLLVGDYDNLWYSTDAGESWQIAHGGPAPYPLYAALLFTTETNAVAGTSNGVYHSTDGGQNWTWGGFDALVVSLSDVENGLGGRKLLAGTYSDGIYQSSDNGASWTVLQTLIDPPFILNHANSIVSPPDSAGGQYLIAASDYGVFRSADGGTHWTGLDSTMAFFSLPKSIVLANVGTGNTTLFVGDWYKGVFQSTDNGTTWKAVNEGLWETRIEALALSHGEGREATLFAGTNSSGVFKSTDNGTSWTWASDGLKNPLINTIAVREGASGGAFLYAASSGGLFRSTDNGQTWASISGITFADVNALAFTPNGAGGTKVFAGTSGAGVSHTTDGGGHWEAATPIWSWYTQSLVAYPGRGGATYLFAGTGNNGIFRSTDNGMTWEQANSGLTDSDIRVLVASSGGGDTLLFAGTNGGGVFRSTDHGMSWVRVNEGLDLDWHVGDLALATTPGGVRYVFAGVQGAVYRSTNDGTDWTPTAMGGAAALAARTTTTGTIELFAARDNQVFRSTDFGASGTWATVGPDTARIITLFAGGGADVFAGTALPGEVYYSSDNGTNWKSIGTGWPGTRVNTLALSDGILFAGTGSAGIWYRPLSEIVSVKEPGPAVHGMFSLDQNYPNPFNPGTVIRFSVPTTSERDGQVPHVGDVRLVVYDVLGREVAVLVNERKVPGHYEVSFDGTGLASGVYIYRLTTGSKVASRHMMLIK